MERLFWISFLLLLYVGLGYPLVIKMLAGLRPRRVARGPFYPLVTMLIVAQNEEEVIGQKLENCLSLVYPKGKLEIAVASDGSSDATNNIVRNYEKYGVRLFDYPECRGKAAAINATVPKLSGEIILFSDARQFYEKNAVEELVANFNDPQVGAASGELVLREPGQGAMESGLGIYWRYEKFIRRCESQFDSTIGTTGAIYAIRKELFVPLPDRTILDDLIIPMNIVFRNYRVVFDTRARAYDQMACKLKEEFIRKVRNQQGNFQSILHMPRLLIPGKNRLFFQYLSHKALRLLLPYLTLSLLISNLFLHSAFYLVFLIFQMVFYGWGFKDLLLNRKKRDLRLVNISCAFLLLSASGLVGLFKMVTGKGDGSWKKARFTRDFIGVESSRDTKG